MVSQCLGPLAHVTPAAQQHGQIPPGDSVSLGQLGGWGGETVPPYLQTEETCTTPSFKIATDPSARRHEVRVPECSWHRACLRPV